MIASRKESLDVIRIWRLGKTCVVVENFTTVACSNVETENITNELNV